MSDDLITALSAPPPKDKRTSCYYAKWIAQQSEEVQQAVEAALKNARWKTMDIFQLLKDRGYERQYNTLRTHRVGQCSCG